MPQHYQQILHELAVLRFSFSFKSAVCHAELNAIMNKNSADVKGCTMYVALFPCNECAKAIIQSGIKTICYDSDKYAMTPSTIASKRMLDAAGVKYYKYEHTHRELVIKV